MAGDVSPWSPRSIALVLAMVLMVFVFGLVCVPVGAIWMIGHSHVAANEPRAEAFDRYLQRDLTRFFTEQHGRPVDVKFELLRRGATQSGIAFPKYYAWVEVASGGSQLTDGAVRVAGIEGKRFDVTDFVTAQSIREDSVVLGRMFPAALVPEIRRRAVAKR